MKKKVFKLKKNFVLGLSLGFVILCSSFAKPSFASTMPNPVYEFKNKEYLGQGVVYENIKTFTTTGLWDINVIRVDIKNGYTELRGLVNPEGLNYRDTVTDLVNKHNALGGVNGDYFNYQPEPSAMGTLINKGKVISSPIERAYALPTFYIDSEGNSAIDYFHRYIIVKSKDRDATIQVNTLNKVTPKFDSLTILNRHWGYYSTGNKFYNDLIEVVVDGDRVVDIRIGQEPVLIPENGYIISGRLERGEVLKSLQIGERLDLFIDTKPDLEKIEFAIGGGSTILRDGKTVNTNIVDKGKHPRTGIAVNEDKSEVILVTVDGRVSSSQGMTQENFSELLRNLGGHNALNLDGGGSTTMAIKGPNREKAVLANKPSQGSQRKVVNGVGVFSNAPKGILNRIEISLEDEAMFLNTKNKIQIRAYDGYSNPLDLDPARLKIQYEGSKHRLEDSLIIPEETGEINIGVSYEEAGKTFTDSKTLKVHGELANIYLKNKELKVDPNGEYGLPPIYGEDINGSSARLSLRDLDLDLDPDVARLENGKILTSSDPLSGYLVFSLGQASDYLKIISSTSPEIGPEPEVSDLRDQFKKDQDISDPKGYKLAIISDVSIPVVEAPNDFIDNIVVKEGQEKTLVPAVDLTSYYDLINKSTVAISLNGYREEFKGKLKNQVYIDSSKGYTTNKRGDLFIVNLDSRKGGLIASNSYQWIRLKNEIKARKESNIILTSNKALEDFSNREEALALHQALIDLRLSGKNVFFVQASNRYDSRLEDGIRYLYVDSRINRPKEDLEKISVLEFTLNGSDISYDFKN